MANTNTNTNMTTSSGLTPGMQTYYNRELLRTFEPNLVHLQFGDEHRMPPHSGLVMNMRKLIPLETNTKALSEGDPGESVMLAETEVTVQLQQYGEYARCTDKLDLTHLDMDIMRRTKLFGDAGARSIDAVVREELAKCANVIYANGKTSRASLTAADKLTSKELRKAVFVSTGGNPTATQMRGVLAVTRPAEQHICFDTDLAGMDFTRNLIHAMYRTVRASIEETPERKPYLDSIPDRDDLDGGNIGLLPEALQKSCERSEAEHEKALSMRMDNRHSPAEIRKQEEIARKCYVEFREGLREFLGSAGDFTFTREQPEYPHKDWNALLLAEIARQESPREETAKEEAHEEERQACRRR